MKTREQWLEEVLSRIRTISDCNILYEYEKDMDQIQALLLEVPFHSADVVCVPRKELEEVVRISDRKHDAWDAVKKAIAASPEYKDKS